MLAEANTSAFAPLAISSFSRPDAPNFACTLPPPRGFESRCHLGQRGAQAAGGVEQDRFLRPSPASS